MWRAIDTNGLLHMPVSSHHSFDHLIEAATAAPLKGWDFSFLRGRVESGALPWNYRSLAHASVSGAVRVLDVDTGGGEFLGSLRPPVRSVALEPYQPNVEVAADRLRPLGIDVIKRAGDTLPVENDAFDLVLNRHGHLNAAESFRVLTPGGRLLSQQVGARNDVEFNEALGIPASPDVNAVVSVEELNADLQAVGFDEVDLREALVVTRFLDVGAVVFQLRAVPWQVPGFDPARHRDQLTRIHEQIKDTGWFAVRSQRFLIQARRPVWRGGRG